MQNQEAVVIPMKHDETLTYSVICGGDIELLWDAPLDLPFSESILNFINELSKSILSNLHYVQHPEMVAMAFWMRKSSILKLKQEFFKKYSNHCRLPRGLVFHIAPANVDIMFMYSWLLSMLVGNKNIVRLPSQATIQSQALLELINQLLMNEDFHSLRQKIALIRYEHNDTVTRYFSQRCDTRIIWGGNITIQTIRSLTIPPHANELTFANKTSLALINAAKVLSHPKLPQLAQQFYNDTYWYSQQACSSPKFIFWLGKKSVVEEAKQLFWSQFEALLLEKKTKLQAGEVMNKLEYLQIAAIRHAVKIKPSVNNWCNRLEFAKSEQNIIHEAHCGSGLFCETTIARLSELTPFLNRSSQTLATFGFANYQLKNFIKNHLPAGIDRVVPIGKALEFSAHWDGYDLLSELTREVTVQL